MAVKPKPEGYQTVTPYLAVKDAAGLIDFLKQAFGAEETLRMPRADGGVAHAEVKIGDSMVMLGEPTESEVMPATMHLYVEDADSVYRRALQAGATSLREPENMFYGDRSAGVKDRFGNQWWIATHVEDVPPEEMQRRAQA